MDDIEERGARGRITSVSPVSTGFTPFGLAASRPAPPAPALLAHT